jgi:SAM-dependent methyltransferase
VRATRSKEATLYLLRMLLDKGYRHPDQDLISGIKERSRGPRQGVWADLGSGANVYVNLFRRRFRSAYGIDADPAYLSSASRPDILGDILRLPLKDGSADLLTSLMVIEHIPDPTGFGEELDRVLAPGGAFLFVTVNRRYWGSRLNSVLPETLKKRLLALCFRREAKDIFPAFYRLNTPDDITRAFGGRFRLEIRSYREYYGINLPLFWLQHALARAFPRASLFTSNYLVVGRKLAGAESPRDPTGYGPDSRPE